MYMKRENGVTFLQGLQDRGNGVGAEIPVRKCWTNAHDTRCWGT